MKWSKVDKTDTDKMALYLEAAEAMITKVDNTLSAAKAQKLKMLEFLKVVDSMAT